MVHATYLSIFWLQSFFFTYFLFSMMLMSINQGIFSFKTVVFLTYNQQFEAKSILLLNYPFFHMHLIESPCLWYHNAPKPFLRVWRYQDLYKMADIFQMIISNTFSWKQCCTLMRISPKFVPMGPIGHWAAGNGLATKCELCAWF